MCEPVPSESSSSSGASLGEGEHGRVDREHAAVDERAGAEPHGLEVGRRGRGGVRGVDHADVVGAQQQRLARLEVVDGQQDGRGGVGEPRVAEMTAQRLDQAVRLVALVQVAVRGRDHLQRRAIEDLRPVHLVDRRDLVGGHRVRLGEPAGDDPARRRAGDQVDHARHPAAGAALDLGQHERRDEPADAAAVDRERLHRRLGERASRPELRRPRTSRGRGRCRG